MSETINKRVFEKLSAEKVDFLQQPYGTFADQAEAQGDDAVFANDLRFSSDIAVRIQEESGLALAVGGFARDSVIARLNNQRQVSKDIDIEVYGIEFDRLSELLQQYGKLDLVGASFGIAKVTNPQTASILDFSIPREDSKVDIGHRGFRVTGNPEMSVQEAARRRDLTINALALDPLTGELIDCYGGVRDIVNRTLRATDSELFKDDPLRVLRVMQFAGRFDFEVDSLTADICCSLNLSELPKERVGDEWMKLMTKSLKPSIGLEVAKQLGVLEKLHPELASVYSPQEDPDEKKWQHTKRSVDEAAYIARSNDLDPKEAVQLLFSTLTADLYRSQGSQSVKSFLAQMSESKIRSYMATRIIRTVENHLDQPTVPDLVDKEIHEFAIALQTSSIRLWELFCRADASGDNDTPLSHTYGSLVLEHASRLGVENKPADPIIQGRDLIKYLSLKPGPEFGDILSELYEAQISGMFSNTEEGIEYYSLHLANE